MDAIGGGRSGACRRRKTMYVVGLREDSRTHEGRARQMSEGSGGVIADRGECSAGKGAHNRSGARWQRDSAIDVSATIVSIATLSAIVAAVAAAQLLT
jgi:hypothetical protein